MPGVFLCLLWSFGLLAVAAKPHDGRNGLPPVTLLFRLEVNNKTAFCGIQEPKEPALVSESEWYKLLSSSCYRLVGLSESEFENFVLPHLLPKVFEYIARWTCFETFKGSSCLSSMPFAYVDESLHPMVQFEYPRQGEVVHPYNTTATVNGATNLVIDYRVRLLVAHNLYPSLNLCLGTDLQKGWNIWSKLPRSRRGVRLCKPLSKAEQPPPEIPNAGMILSASISMSQTVGVHHVFAWLETKDNETLNGSLAESSYFVSDAGYNSILCMHKSRHFTRVSDLRPDDIELIMTTDSNPNFHFLDNVHFYSDKGANELDEVKCLGNKAKSIIKSGVEGGNDPIGALVMAKLSKAPPNNGTPKLLLYLDEGRSYKTFRSLLRLGTRIPIEILTVCPGRCTYDRGHFSLDIMFFETAAISTWKTIAAITALENKARLRLYAVFPQNVQFCQQFAFAKCLRFGTAEWNSLVVQMERRVASVVHSESTLMQERQLAHGIPSSHLSSGKDFRTSFIPLWSLASRACSEQDNTIKFGPRITLESCLESCKTLPAAFCSFVSWGSTRIQGEKQCMGCEQTPTGTFKPGDSVVYQKIQGGRVDKVNPEQHVKRQYVEYPAAPTKETMLSGSLPTTISVHWGHDACMTIADENGVVLANLELERLFETRYFLLIRKVYSDTAYKRTHYVPSLEDAALTLQVAYAQLLRQAGLPLGAVHTIGVLPTYQTAVGFHSEVKEMVRRVIPAKRWVEAGHHLAHAVYGFFDSPFKSALVFSYDGGGDGDQNFEIYLGDRARVGGKKDFLEYIDVRFTNFGFVYTELAIYVREVNPEGKNMSRFPLHLAGKVMGYCALGKVRKAWKAAVRDMYNGFTSPDDVPVLLGPNPTVQDERDLAATSQDVLEELMEETVAKYLLLFPMVDGIVMTGGCALNVLVNQRLRKRFKIPVHVPAAPNDGGQSLGMVWTFTPPVLPAPQALTYMGPLLFDQDLVPTLSKLARSKRINVNELSEILADGKIVAVVRGMQEFGPRALGHRSLLAIPNDLNIKTRLNRLKAREWWRPVAPVVTIEDSKKIFESNPWSPAMSFAATVKPEYREKLPAVVHFDNTARLQTVTKRQNGWLWKLLNAVKRFTGTAILCNTSFNTKGKPILNRAVEAMQMLCELEDLDYVVIDDMLFDKEAAMRTKPLWGLSKPAKKFGVDDFIRGHNHGGEVVNY
jgi:carbamoyltransferase